MEHIIKHRKRPGRRGGGLQLFHQGRGGVFRAAGRDEPTGYKETASQRARGTIGLRKPCAISIKAQTESCDDDTLHELQYALNRQYDAFVKKHGYIHDIANRRAFSQDAGYPLLLALEELDDEQNVKGKSDIFTQRTIRPHIAVTSADTPQDALGLSLAERGEIDFAYMSRLLGECRRADRFRAARTDFPRTGKRQVAAGG